MTLDRACDEWSRFDRTGVGPGIHHPGHTLSGFGVGRLLGEHQGFVNVDENLLFDDPLELLPRESVVLELLQSIRPTEAVVRLCEQLWAGLEACAPPPLPGCHAREPETVLAKLLAQKRSGWTQTYR